MLACGHTAVQIGDRLDLTTGTAKVYASQVFKRIGLRGRSQFLNWWHAKVKSRAPEWSAMERCGDCSVCMDYAKRVLGKRQEEGSKCER